MAWLASNLLFIHVIPVGAANNLTFRGSSTTVFSSRQVPSRTVHGDLILKIRFPSRDDSRFLPFSIQ